MKRIVASVGLVALGTSGLQAATASSLTAESAKPWTVSATLRGFYDDNLNAVSDKVSTAPYHRGTFGFEVSPAISLKWPWEQSSASLGYVYAFKDYQNRPRGNSDCYDMTHNFNASLDHTFSELYRVSVRDSFVIGQEPDFLRAGNTYSTFSRVSGNNMRNSGSANLDGQITPLLGFELGYANAYFNYAADAPPYPSLAGLLNRLEHVIHLDSRWQLHPETVGVAGYQFSETDFTQGQPLIGTYTSESRNSRSQYGYVGVDHTFRPDLTGSVRVGARYTDYYNDPGSSPNTVPYVQLSLRWNYGVESYVEAGFTHDRTSTDLYAKSPGATSLTLDSETSAFFGSINHRLAPNLYASLMGHFQDSVYNGGDYQGQSDCFYSFGANLEYRLSNYVSTQLGYNFDRLESDLLNRGFDRNRVYLGVTASY
jgi:hypothetical protein